MDHYSYYLGVELAGCSFHVVSYYLDHVQDLLYRLSFAASDHYYLQTLCWARIYSILAIFDSAAFFTSFDSLIDHANSIGFSDYVAQLLDLLQHLRYLLPVSDSVL